MSLSILQRNFWNGLRSISQETIYTYLSETMWPPKENGMSWRDVAGAKVCFILIRVLRCSLFTHVVRIIPSMRWHDGFRHQCNRNRNQGNNWIENERTTPIPYPTQAQFSHFDCRHCFAPCSPSPIECCNFRTNAKQQLRKKLHSFRDAIGS